MKRKMIRMVGSIVLAGILLSACATNVNEDSTKDTNVTAVEEVVAEENQTEEATVEEVVVEENQTEETNEEEPADEENQAEDVAVRIGGLKGPTTIGLLKLKDEAANNNTNQDYEFTMATAADEITTALVKGDLDIALIPANVASVLYNKTEGKVTVIDINTLGVLYMVSGDSSIEEIADLEGKTVYLTGKGTTPDYVLQYLLTENGLLDKVSLEYKSEATEVAAVLTEDTNAIGLLPQPFVTVACAQNENLKVVLDTTKLWDQLQTEGGSRLVTGVTLVRNDFLNEHENQVIEFIKDHEMSAKAADEELEAVAALAVAEEIIPKEPIAMKAIPNCNITCITGEEMKEALSGYLEVLYNLNPESIGGKLPGEDFYFSK